MIVHELPAACCGITFFETTTITSTWFFSELVMFIRYSITVFVQVHIVIISCKYENCLKNTLQNFLTGDNVSSYL